MRKWGIAIAASFLVLVGGAARAQDVPTDTPSSAPGSEPVAPEFIGVEEVSLTVDGRTVDAAPPGDAVSVIVTIRNNRSEIARDVSARVDDPPAGVRVTDASAPVGDIAAGGTGEGTFGIVVEHDDCQDFVGLGGEIVYAGGTAPLKIAIPVACPGPRLALDNVVFSGGDGDGVPEPGETVRATVILRNDGRHPARAVRARVTVTSEGVTTSNRDLAWADIAPNASARSLSPLTLAIADDAERQRGCEDPRAEPAPVPDGAPPPDKATVAPDTPVSSDGTTSSDGNVSSDPGAVGGGAPGSTGTEPSTVEPVPGTGTIEPLPATAEPVPLPAPRTTEPQPNPEPAADQPAVVTMQLAISASGAETSLEYSNQIYCALEGGAAKDAAPVSAFGARDDTAVSTGVSALPVALVLVVAAAAVGGRSLRVR